MKKFLSLLMSVAVLFSVTSCSQEDITTSIADGNEVLVTLTTTLASVDTRAVYGNGDNVDKLIYNVYDAQNGDLLTNLSGTVPATAPGKFTVQLKMLKGMKYHFVFWAQNEDCEAYTVNEDKTVKVDYAKIVANDDKADAFFGYVPNFDPVTATSTTFKLYRPFAQLNAATTDYDVLIQSGVTDLTSTVTLRTYNTFDISTGDVTGNVVDVAFKEATDIPTVDFHKGDYTYLSMNYVLAAKNQNITNTHFTFAGKKNGNDVVIAGTSYANIPLQQNFRTNILGALLTKTTDFTVEIVPAFDNAEKEIVGDAVSAQAALDNAVAGTTIQLQPGVNYGTLVFRQNAGSKVVDITDIGGDAAGNEKYSRYENITIIGAEGATVDQIDFKTGWDSYASYIDIENLTVKDVTFSGTKTAFNIEGSKGSWLGIDGFIIDNCTMNATGGDKRFVFQQLSSPKVLNDKTSSEYVMTTGVKNMTISNCTVSGVRQFIEAREMENLTITGNTIKNTSYHAILLAVNSGKTYSGNVTITGNTADSIHERFVRMAGAGDAVVVIKDNIVNNYLGADSDFIKVTDGTNVTIENNARTTPIDTVDKLKDALANAVDNTVIVLAGVDFGSVDLYNTTSNGHRYNYANYEAKNVRIIGEDGASFSGLRLGENDYAPVMTGWTFENIAFNGNGLIISLNNDGVVVKNCKFINAELQNTGTDTYQTKNFTVEGCTFEGSRATRNTQLALQNSNGVTVSGCTFSNAAYNAMNITKVYGNVTINGNTINQTADRPLRFTVASAAATLDINNNTIVSNGDSNGELMKVSADTGATVTESNITLTNNTWNGKNDSEVVSGMVNGAYIVRKVFVVSTADEVKTILAQDVTGITINLEAGTYEGLSFTNPANYKAKNVTIIGQNGAKIAGFGINGWSATDNIEIDGLTFKNVTFTSGLLLSTKVMKDVTVEECDFVNDACVHQNDRTESLTNLVVTDCTFAGDINGTTTAVMLENTENVTVTGCTFNNIDFNVLQGGVLTGTVLIDDNTVNGTGDRVFRFVDASNANITISNNTIVSNGDGDGELAKASKPTKVTLTNNTWNGKSDAEVASKLININRATVSTASELVEAIKNNNNGIKDIDLASDITVDQWIMFSETKTISSGQIITVEMDGLNIDGKGHTLTINDIESASNGDTLFDDASNLNIKNLTINYAAGVAGGISLKSGVISKVNFVGGIYGIYPGVGGDILVEDCTFATKADALYFEQERDNLTINRCTFNQLADKNVVLLRGDVKFTNNTVNSGRTVNIVSGSPVVTGNDFNDVRLKVYSAATATVSNNIINNLVFETTTHSSTFTNNTLSAAAQAALDATNN